MEQFISLKLVNNSKEISVVSYRIQILLRVGKSNRLTLTYKRIPIYTCYIGSTMLTKILADNGNAKVIEILEPF